MAAYVPPHMRNKQGSADGGSSGGVGDSGKQSSSSSGVHPRAALLRTASARVGLATRGPADEEAVAGAITAEEVVVDTTPARAASARTAATAAEDASQMKPGATNGLLRLS